jgi:hypothetical protein
MYRFPLDEVASIESLQPTGSEKYPLFFTGRLEIPAKPLDTYLDMRRWSKGVLFANGRHWGRYWSEVGPQYSLFVPEEFLKVGTNRITIFELTRAPDKYDVDFVGQSPNKIVSEEG